MTLLQFIFKCHLSRVLLPLATCCILAGCRSTANTAGIDSQIPAAEADYAAERVVIEKPGSPSTPDAARTYRFGLNEAIEWALKHNLSLLNAGDAVAGSKFNITAAAAEFEIKVTPRISAAAGSTDRHEIGVDLAKKLLYGTGLAASGDTTRTDDSQASSLRFSLSQPLLRRFGREYTEDALLDARFGTLAGERSYYEFQENIVVSVVQRFCEIIRQRELLELNRASAERTRQHLRAARAREKIGLASRIDVLRAEIQLRRAQNNYVGAQEAFGDAIDGFRVLLGFGPNDNIQIDTELDYEPMPVDPQAALTAAFTNRVDLAQACDNIDRIERKVRIARSNVMPELDLVLAYERSGSGDSFADSAALDNSTWSVGLATSADLRRTAEKARLEQVKLDLQTHRRSYRLLQDTIAREVNDAIRRLEKNRKRIDIQQTDTEHARQKLRLAQLKFDRGLADNFDLMEAEEDVIRAETSYISAVTDYIVSQAQLKRTLGTLIEKPPHLLR
jgi:outer membrane protein TolC